jgi:hypothetical protein
MTRLWMIAVATSGFFAMTSTASAQVRDAIYRGALTCTKALFVKDAERAVMEVAITGTSAKYKRPVLIAGANAAGVESGDGSVDGAAIKLTGNWKGDKASYDASYSGTFVRRGAKLTGDQKWIVDGKTYTRKCTGAIKRPLAAFLPKKKKS